MNKFNEYKQLDLAGVSKEVLAQWEKEQLAEKAIGERQEAKGKYIFFEGPPSANGMPGIHHVMARTIKDTFCRFKTMQGYEVRRKAGWDTHGLPVELGVEKMLGITKEDIGKKISVDEYNAACRKEVMKYTKEWTNLTKQMGYWVDLENPYITYDNKYIETLWYLLKELYKKGYLYKGYTIQPYSPAAGTGLSSHELNQPGCYREVKDLTCTARFKVVNNAQCTMHNGECTMHNAQCTMHNGECTMHDAQCTMHNGECTMHDAQCTMHDAQCTMQSGKPMYFIAWTTTPWTLPSNTALCVGPKIDYVAVEREEDIIILAEARMGAYGLNDNHNDNDNQVKIIWRGKGSELVGMEYEQLFPWMKPVALDEQSNGKPFRVIPGDYVTTEDGTGIVHIAPTFGADDKKVGDAAQIPGMYLKTKNYGLRPMVDFTGKYWKIEDLDEQYVNDNVNLNLYSKYAGQWVKNAYDPQFTVEGRYDEAAAQKAESLDLRLCLEMKADGRLLRSEKHVHTYPHCWRTDKPVLYYPLDSWFIRSTQARDEMIALNNTINWQPESTGSGRFGKWLENLNDWNLSRSRYWGTPLPIWRSEDGKEEKCIGSIKELMEEIDKSIKAGLMKENPWPKFKVGDYSKANYDPSVIDLHRPYVDHIVLVSDTGKPMKRELDLIDVWFDSGAMPYAQNHYPFENEDLPRTADFISEGVDQTRGWFFTLHAIHTMIEGKVAYKNVISNGLVLDKNGNKMSKRLGNAVDPFGALDKYGADAVRWYMLTNSSPWENLKFDPEGVDEVRRKFFGTLFNTYGFFALYANVDHWHNAECTIDNAQCTMHDAQCTMHDAQCTMHDAQCTMHDAQWGVHDAQCTMHDAQCTMHDAQLTEIDRWILSKLNSLVKEVTESYEAYEPTKAGRAISDFVQDDLSNWYVRLNRKRFWGGEMNEDKQAAYSTLYTCLKTVAQLMAPNAPFYSDRLYRDLMHNAQCTMESGECTMHNAQCTMEGAQCTMESVQCTMHNGECTMHNAQCTMQSVHESEWPVVDENMINPELERQMALAQQATSMILSLRKRAEKNVRQPLQKAVIPAPDAETKEALMHVENLVKSEVNVKELVITTSDESDVKLVKKIKPRFQVLGKKVGGQMKAIAAKIAAMSQADIAAMEEAGEFNLQIDNLQIYKLIPEDVEILTEDMPGWLVATEGSLTIALDIELSQELVEEGIARELINRIQNLRKSSGLEITDRIVVTIEHRAEIADAVVHFNDYIAGQVLATRIELSDKVDGETIEMDNYQVIINIKKA